MELSVFLNLTLNFKAPIVELDAICLQSIFSGFDDLSDKPFSIKWIKIRSGL